MATKALMFRALGLALVVTSVALAPIRASTQDDAQQLRARVDAFADAFRRADSLALEGMLTPQYVHTNGGSSPLSREQWLSYISSRRRELESGQLLLSRYENQELKIVVYGNTAVVTGLNISEGTRQGAPFSRRLRFTQLWVKDVGGWQRAAFQDAEASP